MSNKLVVGTLMAVAFSAHAKDKVIPLDQADAAALQGKTVALTVHERPSFTAMTAGKAGFALFGAASMISAGNKLVDENHVEDPASLVRTQLAQALRDAYGANVLAPDTVATKAMKAKDLAALHPEADYVFDVRSGGWNYAYFPTQWGKYWVGYSVQVQLVDTHDGKLVSNAACNANTHGNAKPPTKDQLHANGAQLLKDVTTGLGWTCVQLLSKEQLQLPADKIAQIPAEYVDPLARIDAAATPAADGAAAGATAPADAGSESQAAAGSQ